MTELEHYQEHLNQLRFYSKLSILTSSLPFMEYFDANISHFQITVVDDGVDLDDSDFSASLPLSLIKKEFKTPIDYLSNYVHLMGHRLFNEKGYFWHANRIPKNSFSESAHGLIEDIYLQRLFRASVPIYANRFYEIFLAYNHMQNYRHPEVRMLLNSMLTETPHPDLPHQLASIHKFVQISDPLDQETFNLYIRYWYGLMRFPEFVELVEKYDA